jgi:hypothetical protein
VATLIETVVRDMQMKIQQTPHARLLVSAALLEKLVFGSGFELANIICLNCAAISPSLIASFLDNNPIVR